MKKVVYIAGYGRSGSTILDIKINKIAHGLSAGEIGFFYTDISRYSSPRCGCGQDYKECEVWGKAYERKIKDAKTSDLNNRFFLSPFLASPFYALLLMLQGFFPSRERFYIDNRDVLDEAFRSSFSGVVVDSTKTAWFGYKRPYFLRSIGYEVLVVHIERPLQDVLSSVKKGDNKVLMGDRGKEKLFKGARAWLSYHFANRKAEKLAKDFPYLFVSQLELRDNECSVLSDVKNFLSKNGVDVSHDEGKGKYHVVGGNRLKYSE